MTKSILVTGSRGIIGTQLCKSLRDRGHIVIGTRRPNQNPTQDTEITIEPWINLPLDGIQIDLVVHLAGAYITKHEPALIEECFNANVGLAATVANFQSIKRVPVVALGSFFEKAPAELQPWTYYAVSKIASFNLLKEASAISKSKLIYLYLYDTYSADRSRGKFIDLLVDAIINRTNLDASAGNQVQDLTHIGDVSQAITQAVESVGSLENGVHEYQIRSREVITLQGLAAKANSASKNPININWGKYPYRNREVFELWDSAPDFPNWEPKNDLSSYFSSVFSSGSDGGQLE